MLTGVVGGGQRQSVGKHERVKRELVADECVVSVAVAESDVEMIDGERRRNGVSVDHTQRVASDHRATLVTAQILLQHNQTDRQLYYSTTS